MKVLLTLPLLPPTALVGTVLLGSWGLQTAQMYVTVLNVGAEAFQKCMLHVLLEFCGHFPQDCNSAVVEEAVWQGPVLAGCTVLALESRT